MKANACWNPQRWTARYADAFGEESAVVLNDGKTVSLQVRGMTLSGSDFDSLRAPDGALTATLPLTPGGDLCSCTFEWEAEVPVQHGGGASTGLLWSRISLGAPLTTGGLDREGVELEFCFADLRVRSRGTSGWWEDELLDIARALPADTYLKICFSCLYSDYSPYGHGSFGCLTCHRGHKSQYLAVRTKADYFHVPATETVQETYLCPEFERRIPGTGYRG
jgi:hypothetical protein